MFKIISKFLNKPPGNTSLLFFFSFLLLFGALYASIRIYENSKYQAPIGIIGAMDEEISCYLKNMKKIIEKKEFGLIFYSGQLFGKNVVVVKSGVGKINAAICCQILIKQFNVSKVIFTGVAGGLNPKLRIYDIVISKDSIRHDLSAEQFGFQRGQIPYTDYRIFEASRELRKIALEQAEGLRINIQEGRILSGDQFISDKLIGLSLRSELSGDCVDMESAAVAYVCEVYGIEHLIIRSISDNANKSAPIDFTKFCEIAARNSYLLVEKIVRSIDSDKNV